MKGFYFSNNINKRLSLDSFEKYSKLHKTVKTDRAILYIFHNEPHEAILESDSLYVANMGVLIYKNEWNRNALQLLFDDLQKGFDLVQIMKETRGQFCLVLFYMGRLYIITDKIGSFTIYCYKRADVVEMSNLFLPLARNNKVTLNYQAIAEYVSSWGHHAYCYDKHMVNEIDSLHEGTIYSIDNKIISIKYYNILDNLTIGKYSNLSQVIDMTKQLLFDNLSFLKNTDNIYVDLTGGIDTRLNIAVLMKNGHKFSCGNFGNRLHKRDEHLSKQIADMFHLTFNIYTDEQFDPIFDEATETFYDITGGIPHTYYHSKLLGYIRNVGKTNDILITGLGGTELLSQNYREYVRSEKHFGYNFLYRYFPYIDIIKTEYISEKEYYRNLRQFIDTICAEVRSKKIEDIGTYIARSMVTRSLHGRWIGAINCIIPFYSPYLESDFIKLALETSFKMKSNYKIQRYILSDLNPRLSNIICTKGFPTSRITPSNFYKFKPFFPLFLRKMLDFQNVMFARLKGKLSFPGRAQKMNTSAFDNELWIERTKRAYKDDMKIFELIDKTKLKKILPFMLMQNKYFLLSKLVILNRLITNDIKT